jgi:cyclophilin family peptidyl-prolyl cis-trans isomerase
VKVRWFIAIFVFLSVALGVIFVSQAKEAAKIAPTPIKTQPIAPTVEPTPTMNISKPDITIDKAKLYKASLKTEAGDIEIELYANKTPITVNNFVYLARQGFYDNTIFHRVIQNFMIQGGDPQGTGAGGPGYNFDDEPFEGEYTRGTVAMANAGPNTNGSQFFIIHKDTPLPKNYVIFGKVVGGLEVVDKIASAETTYSLGGEKSKPTIPVKITSVEITESENE